MSWEDRDYSREDGRNAFGRPGGDWQGLRPSFDNPFSWSVLLFRAGGVAVRIHLLFLLFIVVKLLQALFQSAGTGNSAPLGLAIAAIMMAVLFVIVLTHEFGHVLACRWWKGTAEEILMWPLGGLAFCRPPHRWRAHLATAVGGPMVNVILCLVASTMLYLVTHVNRADPAPIWTVTIPNPLNPFDGLYYVLNSYALITLYMINALSLLLLLFNLLPLFPLDGGRILQAALWPRFGYPRSMRLAVRVGFIGAILLFIFGFVISNFMLVFIAFFGGVVCYQTGKQLDFTEDFMGFEDDEYMIEKLHEEPDEPLAPKVSARALKREEKLAREAEDKAAEVDRILQKIAESGISSLSAKEKKLLQGETERKRREN